MGPFPLRLDTAPALRFHCRADRTFIYDPVTPRCRRRPLHVRRHPSAPVNRRTERRRRVAHLLGRPQVL